MFHYVVDNIFIAMKATVYISEQWWRNFDFFFFFLLAWSIWWRNQNVLTNCSRCAVGQLVQMAVPGGLFPTIFSMCLHLFENDRANVVIHEPDVELVFTSHHNARCLSTCKQM